MVEIRDGKKVLITPVTAQDLEDIKVGDIIYLDGSMTTCRDVAHRRLVEEGRELPVDVRNNAIFHTHACCRTNRYHLEFIVFKRSDNRTRMENRIISYIYRNFSSFFYDTAVCYITACCHASV